MPSLKDQPYPMRLETLKIPTLSYRRLRGDLIQVFKIMHGFNDVQTETFFQMAKAEDKEEAIKTRGNEFKVQKRHARLEIRKNSFTQRVVTPWNRLPNKAVCASTVNAFKNEVDLALSKWCDKYAYGLGPEWHNIIVN